MTTIHKVTLSEVDEQTISIPANSDILSVQEQNGNIFLWYLCGTKMPNVERKILIFGTGHEITKNRENLTFLGTVQYAKGILVYHVFELTEFK